MTEGGRTYRLTATQVMGDYYVYPCDDIIKLSDESKARINDQTGKTRCFLTALSGDLLDKLTVVRVLKKFHAFYGTHR